MEPPHPVRTDTPIAAASNGEPPKSVENLLEIALLKARAHQCYYTEIKELADKIRFTFYYQAKIHPANIARVTENYQGALKFIRDAFIGDVGGRNKRVDIQLHSGVKLLRRRFSFQGFHGLIQHLAVQVIAYRLHMAVLLRAQQISVLRI